MVLHDAAAIRGLVVDPEMSRSASSTWPGAGSRRKAAASTNVLDVMLCNTVDHDRHGHPVIAARNGRWNLMLRRLAQFNPARRARRNVAHHYDLNGRLYRLFLDRDWQYSCAYFPTGSGDAGAGADRQEAPHRGEAAGSTVPISRCSTSAAAGAAWR